MRLRTALAGEPAASPGLAEMLLCERSADRPGLRSVDLLQPTTPPRGSGLGTPGQTAIAAEEHPLPDSEPLLIAPRSHQRPSLLTMVVLVAALYLARELLIPFALAFLLAPTLATPVAWLQRCRLGRAPSVVLVMILVCAVLGVTTWFLGQQVTDLITRLPEYQTQIVAKIESLRGGMLEKATDAVNLLAAGIETTTHADPASPRLQEVRVVAPTSIGLGNLTSGLGLVFGPLGTLTVVLLLATFILLQAGDLRDRIVHLIGVGNVNLTTQAMSEIGTRVSQYLRMHLVLNVVHGTVVGLGLFAFGVPNALVWGLLSTLLRFIPYLGPIVAAVLPVALSLAVFDGWERPMLVAAFLLTIEAISNNLLEPWLYGKSSGVSTLAVIASAVFWAWVWGPVGLVLAMPVTVALVVIGKHVPQLYFLNVLLGEQLRIEPSVRVYQRLLALDQTDVGNIAERALAEQGSFVGVCDTVLIPALALAEFDRHHGALQDFHEQSIVRTMCAVIEDLGEQGRALPTTTKVDPAASEPIAAPPVSAALRVLCIPAKNELDQIVGLMLCQALGDLGIDCQLASPDAQANEKADRVGEHRSDLVCISALPPSGLVQSRYLAKRLRARFPQLEIVVGLWGRDMPAAEALSNLRIAGPCTFTTTIAAACEQIQKFVEPVRLRQEAVQRAAAASGP